ncbi:TVG0965928 [Thermoplasma volcanium GSS1]|uniref:TVG0965928 protein n=1 Tax=Thermoplasma volcanium (strain ATCC 51530 / DSM 4299 / JCM 9571 / NBRC 15438 / GSS1) TaxID=273116 RepID=Q97A72_THEVO|nr:hypothetical protein [Thermoplasma volcanium]BAB60080.1 TVG0965928 [Thermoplasma volcanium GSS1]
MKFEFEYLKTPEDLMISLSGSFAMAMRNVAEIYSYKGYLAYYSPSLSDGDDSMIIVSLTRGTLNPGLVDFDSETKKIEYVKRSTNPERYHFLIIEPELSTILDKAIYEFEKLGKK